MKKNLIFAALFLLSTCICGFIWSTHMKSIKIIKELGQSNMSQAEELDSRRQSLERFMQYGGFQPFPVPEPGEEEYLLIVDVFGGGMIFNKNAPPNINQLNTKFYVAYDMRRHRILALQDSRMGWSGRDFVIVISTDHNGMRTSKPLKGEAAQEVCNRFGLGFASDRH